MDQNLKKSFEADRLVQHKRKNNHEDLFIEKLYATLPVKKRTAFYQLKIAASILVLLGIGMLSYILMDVPIKTPQKIPAFSLKNISPELEEIEKFYVYNINQTLQEIGNTPKNLALVKRYMERLSMLKSDYSTLIKEMNEEGPNSRSIQVLIHNLKLQLELLEELRDQIRATKNSNNERI